MLIQPIEFKGTDDIVNNIELYKQKFIAESVVVFRNANLTQQEQADLHEKLKNLFGYKTIFPNDKDSYFYKENHSRQQLVNTAKADDIMLAWHVEHPYAQDPIVFATWNMLTFNTDNENGKTYFVDTGSIYKEMPLEWQEFLNNCLVGSTESQNTDGKNSYCPISKHWITGKPIIRMRISSHYIDPNRLVLVNNKKPTVDENELFLKISRWISDKVYNDLDIRLVHKWQKGDLVMPDMFKLAHAVTGGFDPKDREFVGMWGFLYGNS